MKSLCDNSISREKYCYDDDKDDRVEAAGTNTVWVWLIFIFLTSVWRFLACQLAASGNGSKQSKKHFWGHDARFFSWNRVVTNQTNVRESKAFLRWLAIRNGEQYRFTFYIRTPLFISINDGSKLAFSISVSYIKMSLQRVGLVYHHGNHTDLTRKFLTTSRKLIWRKRIYKG